MTRKLKFTLLMFLSAGLGLCWYPLLQLGTMQIENSQLLFYSFAAASVLTVSFMALQVEQWRKRALELLIFALIGGVSNVSLHYSLLQGDPIVALSLFCVAIIVSLFLERVVKAKALAISEFLVILSLFMVVALTLLAKLPLKIEWSLLLAVISGLGFHGLYVFNNQAPTAIPIMSRAAAFFIASTWLVGMVLIFSPRSGSFPQENAALFSALYGAVILLPIMMSVMFVLAQNSLALLLLWVTLILSCNLIGGAYAGTSTLYELWLPTFFLLLALGIQLTLIKGQEAKKFSKKDDLAD